MNTIEIKLDNGTVHRWVVPLNKQGQLKNLLGQPPDTIKVDLDNYNYGLISQWVNPVGQENQVCLALENLLGPPSFSEVC